MQQRIKASCTAHLSVNDRGLGGWEHKEALGLSGKTRDDGMAIDSLVINAANATEQHNGTKR